MENYFNLIDQVSIGRNYNWASLNIDLNFNKQDIDLESIINGSKQFGNTQNERIFVHEYVHYLQNFYCSWGGLVFCELVLALDKMGASKVNDNIILKLPLKIKEISDAELWNSGVKHYNKFYSLIGDIKGTTSFEKIGEYPKVVIKEISEDVIIFNNGRISFSLNGRTIREHMAEYSSLLFLNYTDEQIHQDLINSKIHCTSNGTLEKNPEYWILFEFFFTNNYKNVAEGLVLLCSTSLSTASPNRSIIRFFKFLNDFKEELGGKDNLLNIVHGFLATPTEVIAFSFSFYATLKNITEQLALCTKYFDHSFYKFNSIIFTQLMNNIYHDFSSKKIFDNPTLLRDKAFWVDLLNSTGTPIIRYKDKTPIISTYNSDLIDALTYFFGVIKVLEDLTDSSKCNCPFHSEFKICKADYKNDELCLQEPLLVVNPVDKGKDCLYHNAIKLMGFDNRIEL